MKATIIVELKPSVLDPQGKAIQHSLQALGFGAVEDVRAGKVFRITLNDDGLTPAQIETQIREMCERLLANTIVEGYSFSLEESP
ncbi:MAG TPA: phosphoribosylformylglycinamidine synthase subunit PurS [Thermoanaerobaculia bacterium]|nr:phosphoribosylformylglycinamidine synthase subunit PurS [Thermoanaerobaculia bacterium]